MPAWTPGTAYTTGQTATFNGSTYICLSDHSSADLFPKDLASRWTRQRLGETPGITSWHPNNPVSLGPPSPAVILAWTPNSEYEPGQVVSNGGATYVAVDDHASSSSFASDQATHWTLLPTGTGVALSTISGEFHVTDYNPVADLQTIADGVISGGNLSQVSSASHLWTAADVGKTVEVRGAGSGGTRGWTTTIASVTVDGKINLASPALTAVSGVKVDWGTDNRPFIEQAIVAATARITTTGLAAKVILPAARLWMASRAAVMPAGFGGGAAIGIGLSMNLANYLEIEGAGRGVSEFVLSDACRSLFFPAQSADYQTWQNLRLHDFSIDDNLSQGRCALIGNLVEFETATTRINFAHIHIWNVLTKNTARDQTQAIDKSFVVLMGAQPTEQEATQTTGTFLTVDDWVTDCHHAVRIETNVAPHIPNHFYDEIYVRRGRHTQPGNAPYSAWTPQTSVFLVGSSRAGYVECTDIYSENVGDDVIELGSPQRALIARVRCVNPFLVGILIRVGQAPADVDSQRIDIVDCEVSITSTMAGVGGLTGFGGHFMGFSRDNEGSGTADTTTGSTVIANAAMTSGAILKGMYVTGTGIPSGARVKSISGTSVTLNLKATATASGVAIATHQAFGQVNVIRPVYKIDGVSEATFSRAANALGFYLVGVVRELNVTEPTFRLSNFTYTNAGIIDYALMYVNLIPPIASAGSAQGPGKFRLRDFNVQMSDVTVTGTGTFQVHGLWPIGQGEIDVDGLEWQLDDLLVTGGGGFTGALASIGRGGVQDIIRLRRLRGNRTNAAFSCHGVILNSTGTWQKLILDQNDFRYWGGSGSADYRVSSAPASAGSLLTLGRQNHWTNLGTNLGGRISVAADTTLTPVVTSVGVTSTSAVRTLTLPSVAQAPQGPENVITIVDESNAAGTNNIVVQRASADTFLGGATSKSITTNGGILRLYSNGTNWIVV